MPETENDLFSQPYPDIVKMLTFAQMTHELGVNRVNFFINEPSADIDKTTIVMMIGLFLLPNNADILNWRRDLPILSKHNRLGISVRSLHSIQDPEFFDQLNLVNGLYVVNPKASLTVAQPEYLFINSLTQEHIKLGLPNFLLLLHKELDSTAHCASVFFIRGYSFPQTLDFLRQTAEKYINWQISQQ